MKKILIVHESTQYKLALQLAEVLDASGFDAVCSQDLFGGNTSVEIREDLDQVYSITAVFVVLADSKIFQNNFLLETIHEAKNLKKSVNILIQPVTNLPPWFIPQIIVNSRPGERLWNQVLETVKPFFHNQPSIIHPETARLLNIH